FQRELEHPCLQHNKCSDKNSIYILNILIKQLRNPIIDPIYWATHIQKDLYKTTMELPLGQASNPVFFFPKNLRFPNGLILLLDSEPVV
ncbi:MAG: hypothetical protein PHI36_02915, partial [Bacteroidales bacterium]|nr:hypothetical protein [Bacteroidales bacterium]